jgi:ferredoxin
MKVRVDPERGQGHNRCYALAPELFDIDEYGQASARGDGTVAGGQVRGPAAYRSSSARPGHENWSGFAASQAAKSLHFTGVTEAQDEDRPGRRPSVGLQAAALLKHVKQNEGRGEEQGAAGED